MEKILFAGSSDPKTAKILAKRAKIKFGKILIKKFACKEKYVRIFEEVKGKIAYIYQTINQNPDEILIETFLIAKVLNQERAKKIVLIFPILPYSRQERIEKDRKEPNSAQLLATLFEASKIDKIITCHLHTENILKFYKIEVLNIKPYLLFAKEIKKVIKNDKNWQVVAPDEGALNDARSLAQLLGNLEFSFFEKKREDPAKKANFVLNLVFKGKLNKGNVILFDDMVDTGQTIIKAKRELEKLGAKKIILAATHPILSGNAKEKLEKEGFYKIFFSNSILHSFESKKFKILDLTFEIAKYL